MAKKQGSKVNQPMFVVLAVVSLVVLIPMMAGGTIALAASLSGEEHYATTPADANGYRVIGSSTDSTSQYCDWKASSLPASSHSGINNRNSVNYTGITISPHYSCSNSDQYLEIQLPSDVLPNPANLTMSKFSFTMISRNYATGLSDVEKTNFDFDININGTTVIFRNNHSTFAGFKDSTTGNVHFLLNFNITPSTSEILDFNNEVGKCWPSCIVSVNLSDYKTTGVQHIPWEQGYLADLQTVVYTTDADTAGVVLTVAPYLLALVNMLVALASTSYWNPVFGSLKKKAGGY